MEVDPPDAQHVAPSIHSIASTSDPTVESEERVLSSQITHMIIDEVYNLTGLNGVKTCSLVAGYGWLSICRGIIFRRLALTPLTDTKELYEIFTEERLLPFVRKLDIRGHLTYNAEGEEDTSGMGEDGLPDHSWITALVPFLQRLNYGPKITSIKLYDLDCGCMTSTTLQFLLSHFSSIARLHLSSVNFRNANQFIRILDSFPALRSLKVNRTEWGTLANATEGQLTKRAPLRLKTLRLGPTIGRYSPVTRWLCGQRELLVIEYAWIVWEYTELMDVVELIRVIAPSLKRLKYIQSITHSNSDSELMPSVREALNREFNTTEALGQMLSGSPFIFRREPETWDKNAGDRLEDDEPVDSDFVNQLMREWTVHRDEGEVLHQAMAHLAEAPIQNSAIPDLNMHLIWSRLAMASIKMFCQLVSVQARHVCLTLELEKLVPGETEWALVDDMLDAASMQGPTGGECVFELRFCGPLVQDLLIEGPRIEFEGGSEDEGVSEDEDDYADGGISEDEDGSQGEDDSQGEYASLTSVEQKLPIVHQRGIWIVSEADSTIRLTPWLTAQ
ncbi:hypothetical protein POSPLADRAFT_1055092 [Postia placenta MAD-698-R-SB12]|uniref:F-box domain-containing protein n=1 Tax=Postia placenta MAD-698-R-SB12 TaxID=670580 RepID=A0A1X6N7M4_9APHY|nr:hypothetical protein POSPLADRAFT_1055092 [Postia placenta MAD-698-R-SB12]OSX64476.1 hypothetical protein POSPLADRAFT_1055092 [Postia placenta MAD-698-R-SB12]